MDTRRLLIFREVARAGSISAAARTLGWTQPAVSQHLRALERAAGSPLLLRGATGVSLTEPGRVLLARADEIALQAHLAEQELSDLTALRRGRARLAAYPSAAATVVPRAVARMRARHPDIDVDLAEVEPPEALALLEAGEADLALVFGYDDPPVGDRPLVWRELGVEPVGLVLAADHPWAARPRPSLAEFADEPWIVGCERCRAHAVHLCGVAGFEPRIRHASDDYVVVQNLVAVGLGVSLLPHTALEAFRHPEVVAREHPSFGTRHFGLAYRPGAEAVPAIAALRAALEGAVRDPGRPATKASQEGSGTSS